MSYWYEINLEKNKWEVKRQYQNLQKINYAKGSFGLLW